MYLKGRIQKLERTGGAGGRNIVVLKGNDLTDWAALEKRYFEEYDRSPADNDLFIQVICFGSTEPDILQVIEAM